MGFKATPAQQAAIETTDSSIVLSAGAGSGKTRVLVQRYLHLLREGAATVDQILAITFTNKAAGEMKERIMKEVFKIANQATSAEEKEFWRQVKEDLNQAQITTFHGFCGQILRKHPMEAGVDPFFRILDEVETEDFLDDSVEEIFLEGLEAKDSHLLKLGREFSIYATNELLKSAFRAQRMVDLPLDQLAGQTLATLEKRVDRFAQLKAEITQLAEDLIRVNQVEKLSAGTKKKLDELEAKWEFFQEKIRSIQSLRDWDRKVLGEFYDIFKGNVAKAVKEDFTQMKELLDQFDTGLADLRAQELIPSLIAVLKQIEERYQSKKEQVNGLDFDDLEKLTLQLLKEQAEFCARYRNRYNFIMVDEFQDTNPVQEELIRLLIGGSSQSAVTGNKLFIVGDPKQSIYKFRGADVTVFKKLQQEIQKIGTEIHMVKNFRSRGKIIDFVNHFFERIFGTSKNPYDMGYQASEYFRTGQPEDVAIELQILDQKELKAEDLDKREEEADLLARRIRQMVVHGEKLVYEPAESGSEVARPVGYGDISLLYQALTNVQVYEEALQRYRIPYTVVKGRGFFQRQEIWDLLNLLKLVDNSQRVIEWYGVLRSPFCGLSDENLYWLAQDQRPIGQVVQLPAEEWEHLDAQARSRLHNFMQVYRQIRATRERTELSRVMTYVLEETGYWKLTLAHPYGDLVRANLDKLIGLAREYEGDAQSSLNGFIKFLERMDEKEAREGLAQIAGQTDQVKLMTVHQSKGLEFPVVILPDTQRPLINPTTFPTIAFDAQYGLGLRVNDPVHKGTVRSSLHQEMWEEEKRREIAESKRLLYVAATRARDYLLVSGTAKKFKPTEIDECKSWLDWIAQVFDFGEVAQLPETVPYGPEEEDQIKINPVIADPLALEETASTTEAMVLQNWAEIYQTAGVGPITPQAKSTYHQFGVSQLLTYDQCPRWYYHKYIQKMPDNIVNPLGEQSTSPSEQLTASCSCDNRQEQLILSEIGEVNLFDGGISGSGKNAPRKATRAINNQSLTPTELGTLIHLLCERITTLEEVPALLGKALRYLGHNQLRGDEAVTQLTSEVTPYLQAYLNGEADLQQQLDSDSAAEWIDHREYSFQFKIGNSLIRGVIDRLLISPSEAWIIDYKSNRISKGELEKGQAKYQLQMELYALAVHYLTGLVQIKTRLHFLAPDQTITRTYGETELQAIEARLHQTVEEIISATQQGVEEGHGQRDELQAMLQAFPCGEEPTECQYHNSCAYHRLCKESDINSGI